MGGKSKKVTVGYWYKVLYHAGLCKGPFDAFLEFRGGSKPAWTGELKQSGTISIDAPNLWGGEKDQGGIVGDVDVMFGESDQQPNSYMLANLGSQIPAWRGLGTLVFKGGKYGAMNPYPQKASYKIRKILKGWDNDTAWYPEKAVIDMSYGNLRLQLGELSDGWSYKIVASGSPDDYSTESYDHSSWDVGASPFASATGHPYAPSGGWPDAVGIEWPINTTLWVRRIFTLDKVIDLTVTIFVDNYSTVWVNGQLVLPRVGSTSEPSVGAFEHTFTVPASILHVGENVIALKAEDEGTYAYAAFRLTTTPNSILAMNPAHVLYYSRTNSDMGREPTANINDADLRAEADRLYDEGFGICPVRDPASESVEDFEKRICKLIGGSFSRDLIDGQWHLDLARGDYELEELPVLTDDDILEFKEVPSTLDNAINSVSVKYFDPNKKEEIVTPPAQAHALIMSFGTIHQTNHYPEIPTAELAGRVAMRDLLSTATPTRVFELVTTRKTYAWRPNQYFRLQAAKRGIQDMVCIVGEKQSGTLRSGAIRMKATQDIYSLPTTSFVEIEPGVDTSPSQVPSVIAFQRAFEAPYIDVVAALPRAELEALPPDIGFLEGVASDPAQSRDYTMMVSASGSPYTGIDYADWCPTATVVEEVNYNPTSFTLVDGKLLDLVTVGAAVLWDDEIGRVDAINPTAGTIQIARGCADTVPQQHAAGSRLWFWQDYAATDVTEYTTGESINVKLLTNTGSQQLAESAAVAMSLTFQQRQARPYPPANLHFFGSPLSQIIAVADIPVSWVPRNRVTQADQLLDTTAGSITPEAGNSYRLNFYGEAGTLTKAYTGLTGTSQTWTTEVADSALYEAIQPVQFFEQFGTGIPGGYGTPVTSSVVPTVTFAASTGAVDLNNQSTSQCYWEITSMPLMVELDVEVDVEILNDYTTGDLHAGLWLLSGAGAARGMRLSHYETLNAQKWHAHRFNTAGSWTDETYLNLTSLAQPTMNLGQRRRLRATWSASTGLYQFFVDGVKVLEFTDTTFKALRAGIFFYNCNLRVPQVLVRGVSATSRRNNLVRVTLDSIVGTLPSLQKHDRTLTRVGYGYSYGTQYGGT